ncbi:histidine phosphatase family protein [bacterium]|nr:MAG: histidine phosphatase family protein [bacterium]
MARTSAVERSKRRAPGARLPGAAGLGARGAGAARGHGASVAGSGGGALAVVRIVVVRHGITEWNAARRFQGQTDIALSEVGRLQARSVGKRLHAERFQLCVASDLQRTRETAERILAEIAHPPTLHLEPELREMNFGVWEGLTFDEVAARWPDEASNFHHHSLLAPPGGETWAQFDARVTRGFERHRARVDSGAALLLVVHGGVIHALVRRLMNLGDRPAPIHVDPAGVTEIETEGETAWMRLLNDRCHLEGLSKADS